MPLTDNVATLTAGINGLSAAGLTNHQAAFDLAAANYTPILSPVNRKILIMITDGDTTVGGNASIAAQNARIALGVIVTEIINGVEYSRGFKAMTIPGQSPTSTPCTSFFVRPITFIFPENLDGSPGLCSQRIFNVRVIAHYIDTGITSFDVCPIPVVPV